MKDFLTLVIAGLLGFLAAPVILTLTGSIPVTMFCCFIIGVLVSTLSELF